MNNDRDTLAASYEPGRPYYRDTRRRGRSVNMCTRSTGSPGTPARWVDAGHPVVQGEVRRCEIWSAISSARSSNAASTRGVRPNPWDVSAASTR